MRTRNLLALSALSILSTALPVVAQTVTFLDNFGSNGSGNGQFIRPRGVAVDRVSGLVYVTDYDFNLSRVQYFSASGDYLGQWGGEGTGNNQFQTPAGITVDHARNRVYVADFSNNRIGIADLSGNFVAEWTNSGVNNGAFSIPADVAVLESTGDAYVAEEGNTRVQRVEPVNGHLLGQIGGYSGSGLEQFNNPIGIAINQSTGQVYVADSFNHRIQRFDFAGGYQMQWNIPSVADPSMSLSPTYIALDAAGHVYVSVPGNSRVERYSADGVFELAFGTAGTGDEQMGDPEGLAVSSDGIVYVADESNHRVSRWQITEKVVVAAPELSVTGKKKLSVSKAKISLKGTGSGSVTSVTYTVGNKKGIAAGTTAWKITAALKPGKNTIRIVAHGPGGDSTAATVIVTRK